MRLADAHIHLFRSGPGTDSGAPSPGGQDLPEYEALRRVHGIDRALVVGFEGARRHARNNADVIALAAGRNWIVPVAYLPVWPAPTAAALDILADRGFFGVALWIPDTGAADAVARWPADSRRAVVERFHAVSLNARAEVTDRIGGFVRDLAPLTTLFSHLGLPGRYADPPPIDQATARLSALLGLSAAHHVAVKLSGLYATSEPRSDYPHRQAWSFIDVLFGAFGPERMYWGSDFRPATTWVPFERTVQVYLPPGLTQQEVALVMGGNLLRLTGGPS
jgi:L-fuconolactonase